MQSATKHDDPITPVNCGQPEAGSATSGHEPAGAEILLAKAKNLCNRTEQWHDAMHRRSRARDHWRALLGQHLIPHGTTKR